MQKLSCKKLAIVFAIVCGSLFGYSLSYDNSDARIIAKDREKVFKGLEVGNGEFLLEGEPFVIKAAELHYPRIPRPYWDHRIKMAKALGMNTICLYVFWNYHETEPGKFDFSGDKDLRSFIELCRDNDMKVILRPGPYVCAEWEMGGLPWWLLKDKDIKLRENDPRFLEAMERFQAEIAGQVKGLEATGGGPIIMVQVENEYGSYGKDKEYVSKVRDCVRKNFGEGMPLFQCDWSSNFLDNGLEDLIWTLNFGTGADIDREFAPLRKVRPDSPLMCSEFWSGWFDKWGANHETRPSADMTSGIDSMLKKGISFSLYMTHGGTNFGHWAGANSPGYAPDVTSYDYDAPIDEAGRATPKYHELREVMARYAGENSLPDIPDTIPNGEIPEFRMEAVAPLATILGEGIKTDSIVTMEALSQGFGSIVYRTELPEVGEGTVLEIMEPHDYAQVFMGGRYVGPLDRRKGETSIELPACEKKSQLDILVEAMGRINFGRAIKDFKGITEKVFLIERDHDPQELKNWEIFLLPDADETYLRGEYLPIGAFGDAKPGERYPRGVYKGTFNLDKAGFDTFLDMRNWGKGLVYVNGHELGRFWEIGPQQTVYLPGCWLREGENEVMVFDILGPREPLLEGRGKPVLDLLQDFSSGSKETAAYSPELRDEDKVFEAHGMSASGWDRYGLNQPSKGRYVALSLEGLDPAEGYIALAELRVENAEGNEVPMDNWKRVYVSSEDPDGNHTADKAFDIQESTYWGGRPNNEGKTLLVIDLGRNQEIGGVRLLQRMETNGKGKMSGFRMWISEKPFPNVDR